MFDDDETSVAAKIRNSSIREALKAAIDDWIVSNDDVPQRERLLRITLTSDENPTEWQRQARNPQIYSDKDALTRLLATAPIEDEPVSLLAELGRQLFALKGDAVPFLIKLQQQYPHDFWANIVLGSTEHYAGNNTDAASLSPSCRGDPAKLGDRRTIILAICSRLWIATKKPSSMLARPSAWVRPWSSAA